MKIYLTEKTTEFLYTGNRGERIEANSFEEAEEKCPEGYAAIGELIMEIPYVFTHNQN